MVIEAWKNYVQLASGVTKTTRAKALATAKALIAQAGLEEVAADAGERVSKLADEILSASAANRRILSKFVAHEVDQAVGRLGLARREDLDALRAEIAALRTSVGRPGDPPPAKKSAARKPAEKSPAAKKAAAKKAGEPAARKAAGKAPAQQAAAADTEASTPDGII